MVMRKRTLKERLIQYNLIIVCMVAMLFSIITYTSVNKKVVQMAENSLVNHVYNIGYRYETAYEEMINIIINCTERGAFSPSLVGNMDTPEKRKKGLEYAKLANNFCAITGYGKYINCMVIFNEAGTLIQASTSNGSTNDIERILSNGWFYDELKKPTDQYPLDIRNTPFFGQNGNFLPIARSLHESHSSQQGWVLLGLSTNLFSDVLQQEDSGNKVLVVTHNGERIASTYDEQSNNIESDKLIEQLLAKEQNRGVIRQHSYGKDSVIAYYRYPRSGILVVEILHLDTLFNDNMLIVRNIIWIFIICLLMALLLSAYFTQKVQKPIKQLVDHIACVAAGEFAVNPEIERDDEIGIIGKGVNHMAEQISVLVNQKINDEKEKSNLELQMLQAQINPHFLYNTLDSIKWIAVIQKNSGIVKVVTALSGLLKNMAKGFNEQVMLQKELDFLNDYVTIEKVKYVEMFDLDIIVEEERLYEAMVIKLTLQPLVENSIFSGIEPSGKNGVIKIHIYARDKILYITVWDSGVGIPAEKLVGLFQDKEKLKGNRMSSIGLANVDRRIKLTYGEEYGLTVESRVGEFTKITVKQPLILQCEEEQ